MGTVGMRVQRITRLRQRVGLRLIRPELNASLRWAKGHWDSGHQPGSYHKDFWPGQWFGLAGLVERLQGKERP
jgi:hypothetical protein